MIYIINAISFFFSAKSLLDLFIVVFDMFPVAAGPIPRCSPHPPGPGATHGAPHTPQHGAPHTPQHGASHTVPQPHPTPQCTHLQALHPEGVDEERHAPRRYVPRLLIRAELLVYLRSEHYDDVTAKE